MKAGDRVICIDGKGKRPLTNFEIEVGVKTPQEGKLYSVIEIEGEGMRLNEKSYLVLQPRQRGNKLFNKQI